MIQVNELRIGNKFGFFHNNQLYATCKVSKIGKSFEETEFENDYKGFSIDGSLEAIPITIEILNKLKAVKVYYDKNIYQISLVIFCWHSEYGLCIWYAQNDCILYGSIHFNYLHQLQNIYFDLTGKELKTKEL